MPNITLSQAAAWCGGTVEAQYASVCFFGANNDTRLIQPGQLFLALQGARDGHDFIPGAMERGAAAVLCRYKVGDYPAILVDNPLKAFGDIAREALKQMHIKVVAVTGSVGKSTTKEMIASVLETHYRVSKTPANHNNDIGMPMAILSIPQGTEVAVLEMGMNHLREIAYLSRIARPDIGVIINIGIAHIEFLGSQEGIRTAKMEIVEGMSPEGTLILNGDDTLLRNLPEKPKQTVRYFGKSPLCDIQGLEAVQKPEGLCFLVRENGREFPVETCLEGQHFVLDALAAVAVGLQMGLNQEEIRRGLASFRNMEGRQQTLQVRGVTIINDCYNAGPESMEAALTVLGSRTTRRIAVLADMLELGDRAKAEHVKVGCVAARNCDLLFAYGDYAEKILEGAYAEGMTEKTCRAFHSRQELAQALGSVACEGDVLLFKGSHGMHLERVIDAFAGEEI